MSFEKAIIIPFEMFKNFENNNKSSTNSILFNDDLHASKKMKLYTHEQLLNRKNIIDKTDFSENKELKEKEIDSILGNLPQDYLPYGKSILEHILKHPEEMGWNDNYNIRIRSNIIPFSNISITLNDLMKNSIITSKKDFSPGTFELLHSLLGTGIPKNWIKLKIKKKTPSRTINTTSENSLRTEWISK